MSNDPFADDYEPETEENTTVAETPTVEPAQVTGDQNYVTVILKGGAGYGAPSVSIRGASVSDALRHIEGAEDDLKELLRKTAQFGKAYGILVDGDKPAGGAPQRSAPGPQEHPDGKKEFCEHGQMQFKSGISKKTGKAYSMFVCPSGDRNNECRPKNA